MTNRVKLLFSLLVVILSLNLFSIPSIAEASSGNPVLVEGKIEAVDAGEIEGIIEESSEMVTLLTAYKVLEEIDKYTGVVTATRYDFEYTSYPAGYNYTATTEMKDIRTLADRLRGDLRKQYYISYRVNY